MSNRDAVKDINAWATGAVQQAVDAIRGAESVTHTILIPGMSSRCTRRMS